jgi:hypothetical protein
MQGNVGTFRVGEPFQTIVTPRVQELVDALPYAVATDNIMGYLWGKEAHGELRQHRSLDGAAGIL